MAITEFQRRICRLIAAHRIAQGESYIAGNSWNADKELLEAHGYTVQQLRLLPSFAEASFDLATNKVLALAGRLEARDWIDVLVCHERIQNLGYLFWAACSKDPGFSPSSLLSEARRGGAVFRR